MPRHGLVPVQGASEGKIEIKLEMLLTTLCDSNSEDSQPNVHWCTPQCLDINCLWQPASNFLSQFLEFNYLFLVFIFTFWSHMEVWQNIISYAANCFYGLCFCLKYQHLFTKDKQEIQLPQMNFRLKNYIWSFGSGHVFTKYKSDDAFF